MGRPVTALILFGLFNGNISSFVHKLGVVRFVGHLSMHHWKNSLQLCLSVPWTPGHWKPSQYYNKLRISPNFETHNDNHKSWMTQPWAIIKLENHQSCCKDSPVWPFCILLFCVDLMVWTWQAWFLQIQLSLVSIKFCWEICEVVG